MNCPKCNYEIKEPTKFCPDCGASLRNEDEIPKPTPTPPPAKKGKSKKKIIILIISILSSLLVIAGIIFLILYLTNPGCMFRHNFSMTATVEPSCNTNGYEVYTCADCGSQYSTDLYDDDNLPTGDHDWVISPDTLTKTCSVCYETQSIPAWQALNNDEYAVYSALVSFSKNLKSPTSLTLIDLRVGQAGAYSTEDSIFVKVSAANSFGGMVTEVYVCKNSYLDIAGSSWYSVAGAWPHIGSVRKINTALQEYFSDLLGQ
jgi:hypothetical protein